MLDGCNAEEGGATIGELAELDVELLYWTLPSLATALLELFCSFSSRDWVKSEGGEGNSARYTSNVLLPSPRRSSIPALPDFLQRSSSSIPDDEEQSSSSSVLLPRRNSFEEPGIGDPRAVARLCKTESISLQGKVKIYNCDQEEITYFGLMSLSRLS